MKISPAVLPVLSALLLALPAAGQDVELLGRMYGTRPPPSYDALVATDPGAFRFQRAWAARAGLDRALDPEGDGPGALLRFERAPGAASSGPAAALGSRVGPVAGDFVVPLVLGLYADSPTLPPFPRVQVAAQFFDGPNPTGTITEFYREISGGRVELTARTFDWHRSSLTGAQVAGGASGLGGRSRVGQFIMETLAPLASSVDWGLFDNDGPDGVPNSGDDDGYVDVLAVMHPTKGAECDAATDLVWSHRWSLSGAVGQVFHTTTPAAGGGVIKVDDYTIQPVKACSPEGAINQIGVFAHELGHGFGLPDLYATGDGDHAGIGRWGLMGSGAWGCGTFDPARPCHMNAWSKAALGWVEVETLPADADLGTLVLDPVERSGRVLRVEAGDGSGEYFLLENRQRIGFDGSLAAPGLLVWHVDPGRVRERWPINAVNSSADHMGVWLRQADGRNDLARSRSTDGNRGDAGDPFPGDAGATAFHAGSTPGSFSHRGTAAGVTVTDLALDGERVRFRLLTRYQTLRLTGAGALSSFVVDGDTLPAGDAEIVSAPYQVREVSAPGGSTIRDGLRRRFSGWSDGAGEPRTRTWSAGTADATLTARFDGPEELHLRVVLEGDTAGVAPGAVRMTPASEDGWYEPGTEVAVLAEPRTGFGFVGWGGDLDGAPNPSLVTVAAPVDASAVFEQTFGVDGGTSTVSVVGATETEIVFQARDGTEPYRWSLVAGELPPGMTLGKNGIVWGAALEPGTFAVRVQATDGIGLVATADVRLEVSVPPLGVAALTDPFFLRPSTLTTLERLYLDRGGNQDGVYDLGDFRAFVLDNPSLPMTEVERTRIRTLVPLVDFRRPGG